MFTVRVCIQHTRLEYFEVNLGVGFLLMSKNKGRQCKKEKNLVFDWSGYTMALMSQYLWSGYYIMSKLGDLLPVI